MRKIKRAIHFFGLIAVLLCSGGCGVNPLAGYPEPTPLPDYESSFHDIFFFSEEEDYPNVEEVLAYYRHLIKDYPDDMDALAETFLSVNKNAKEVVYYSTEYGPMNSGKSYLYSGFEPITIHEKEGKAFYDFMEKNEKLCFQSIKIYPNASEPMIGFEMMVAYTEPKFMIDRACLIRGNPVDALQKYRTWFKEGARISDHFHIEVLNENWYLFWTDPLGEEESVFEWVSGKRPNE